MSGFPVTEVANDDMNYQGLYGSSEGYNVYINAKAIVRVKHLQIFAWAQKLSKASAVHPGYRHFPSLSLRLTLSVLTESLQYWPP